MMKNKKKISPLFVKEDKGEFNKKIIFSVAVLFFFLIIFSFFLMGFFVPSSVAETAYEAGKYGSAGYGTENEDAPTENATKTTTTTPAGRIPVMGSGGAYTNQEKIPGAQPTDKFIPYVQSIINFGFAVIGILALFMLIIGAYQYLMAAGSGKADSAKETISSALLGLVLGLCAWIILYKINPDLVNMRSITQITGGGNFSDSMVGTATSAKYGTVAVSGTTKEKIAQYDAIIKEAAQKYPNVSEALIKAVIDQESRGKVDALGRMTKYGQAKGLMQLIPGTASDMGVSDPFNPQQNIMGGTKYLSGLLKTYNGNEEQALAAYNWGSGNLAKNGGSWNSGSAPKETREYVPAVLGKKSQYATVIM